jgi:4-amino-4-deoxy-L-arabinose transferase-like glycosyltransferase
MKNYNWSFYLIVFAAFLLLISPNQWSDGMFLDGLIYASISRNMAMGIGDFWTPYYTAIMQPFYEHPPLAFWLESLFYEVMGDTIYAERIYSFITFLVTGYILVLIWKEVAGRDKLMQGWVPLLFWVSVPTLTWACPNNMLENTMMVFTSLSAYFYIKSKKSYYLLYIFLSSVSVFLGFLTKGPFALFPLSLPFWVWIFREERKILKTIGDSFLLILFMGLPLILIMTLDSQGIESLKIYFEQQVINSITGQREITVNTRFAILFYWFNDLIPSIFIGLIIFFIAKRKSIGFVMQNQSWVFILFFLGLSAVLPIMVSMKQRSFYIIPSFVFFSLSFALAILPLIEALLNGITKNAITIIKGVSVTLAAISLVLSLTRIGKIGRDDDEIKGVYQVIKIVPSGTTIGISEDTNSRWAMHAQFARYGNITLDAFETGQHFLLRDKGQAIFLNDYKKMEIQSKIYDLYKKVE